MYGVYVVEGTYGGSTVTAGVFREVYAGILDVFAAVVRFVEYCSAKLLV